MLLGLLFTLAATAEHDPCTDRGTALYVNAAKRGVWLCEQGVSHGVLRVALGQGGLDKRKQGDAKLPLGEYPLGRAVPSADFHLSLPVGYPTMQQRKLGFTGSAIGVHGPLRGFTGPTSTDRDWTLGCIAVGTDAEIERIAEWVQVKAVRRIIIEAR
jgi:murein L,D-transpeptidase YafK